MANAHGAVIYAILLEHGTKFKIFDKARKVTVGSNLK
jgi:hypothetical protein